MNRRNSLERLEAVIVLYGKLQELGFIETSPEFIEFKNLGNSFIKENRNQHAIIKLKDFNKKMIVTLSVNKNVDCSITIPSNRRLPKGASGNHY